MEGGSIHRLPRAGARASVGIDARSDSTPARLLIADDHALPRKGMRAMLMDFSMPEMGGIEATLAIKEELPRTGVLVLTAYADQEMLLEAIRTGRWATCSRASGRTNSPGWCGGP